MSGQSTGSTQIVAADQRALTAELIKRIEEGWARGEQVTAEELLRRHPELDHCRDLIVDLAFEEYSLRAEAGAAVDRDEFSRQFGVYESSVGLLLAINRRLHEDPDFVLGAEDGAEDDPADPWPQVGETLLGFHLLEELGRGTFARVYLAVELALGSRPVAVKFSSQAADEAEILGKLRHPNIVPTYSVRHDPSTELSAICMPFLGQVTLDNVLSRVFGPTGRPQKGRAIMQAIAGFNAARRAVDPLPSDPLIDRRAYVDAVIHLGAQLADALHYTHSRGVCHGDLKPSNVLMSPDGTPMLLDFNLSLDEEALERRMGGTVPYMAPARLAHSLGRSPKGVTEADPRDDLFSLGVVLYQMLCGSFPFGEVDAEAPIREVAADLLSRQEAGPAGVSNPDVDPPLARLIAGCLAFEAEKRPQSGEQLAAALRQSLSRRRRSYRWVRAHRRLSSALVAGVLAIGVAGGVGLASLPPIEERLVQRGQQALASGKLAEAKNYFSEAVDHDPNSYEGWFGRGRAWHGMGHHEEALRDYNEARRINPNPLVFACIAECRAQSNDVSAVASYSEAIEKGFASAPLLNNFAVALVRKKELAKAGRWLDAALQLDPSLQAALRNRAMLEFRLALREDRLVDPKAQADIMRALAVGPVTGELLVDAALISSKSAGNRDELAEVAFGYLKEAHRLGADPEKLKGERVLRELVGLARLDSLGKQRPVSDSYAAKRRVDPLSEID
ncbi:MAG: protein kinase [Pirellulales bacterium]